MNPYSDSRFVGYVTAVAPTLTKVHFPSSTLLKKFYKSDESYHALTGKYVIIEGGSCGFLGKIIEIALPEGERLEFTESKFDKQAFHPTGKVEILICFDNYEMCAQKGLESLPPVSAKVFLADNAFIGNLLKKFGQTGSSKTDQSATFLRLAHLANDESNLVHISAQALFGRHCAVIGTTGGGKSWTVAKMLEEIKVNNGKAILIDATGEYETLKGDGNEVDYFKFNELSENGIYFNYRRLRETDLFALVRPAGQSQLPKIQEAMKSLRLVNLLLQETENLKSYDALLDRPNEQTFTTLKKQGFEHDKEIIRLLKRYSAAFIPDCNFDIQGLCNQLVKECYNDTRARENCTSLISRIMLTINDLSFLSVFDFKNENHIAGAKEFESTFSKFISSEKKILILSVAQVSTENRLREILVNSIGRFLLDKALSKAFRGTNKKSLLLFLDEAHLFLNKRIKDEFSIEVELDAFERIAKECRKFGLFLVLSTQMPRDIPRGVLSQVGAFIVHRLINQQDREAIEYACSEANKSALSFLPILGSGEALITGVSFAMPMVLKILPPAIEPDSSTPAVL
ncbi:ATP-binding protein [Desertivirga brevis]|uniref:ATP-binding protein n=1 Tax=Desertivirga brevis TaxID=2810310 RepID=UPI001A979CC6|nr:ATP-binding protein [Pedobacter sp. SYSU D00873]